MNDYPASIYDFRKRLVNLRDIHVWASPTLSSNAGRRNEMPDDVARPVFEAGIRATEIHLPTEYGLVEGCRLLRVIRRNPQVGDARLSEDGRFYAAIGHESIIGHGRRTR